MNGGYVNVAGEDPTPASSATSCVIAWRYASRGSRPECPLSGSNKIYAYQEKFSGAKVICKFYGASCATDIDEAAWLARQEYEEARTLRRYNLVGSPPT